MPEQSNDNSWKVLAGKCLHIKATVTSVDRPWGQLARPPTNAFDAMKADWTSPLHLITASLPYDAGNGFPTVRWDSNRERQVSHLTDVDWTFLTNHAHVLLAIASNPTLRLRDIAAIVGITERTIMGILSDLEEAGYIKREKVGRRNQYVLDRSRPLRHPREAHHQVGELLEAIEHSTDRDPTR